MEHKPNAGAQGGPNDDQEGAQVPPSDDYSIEECLRRLRRVTESMCTGATIAHNVGSRDAEAEHGALDDRPGTAVVSLTGFFKVLRRSDRRDIAECCGRRLLCIDSDFEHNAVRLHLCSGSAAAALPSRPVPVPNDTISEWTAAGEAVTVVHVDEVQKKRICTLLGMWLDRPAWETPQGPGAPVPPTRSVSVSLETLDTNVESIQTANVSGMPAVLGEHVVHIRNLQGLVDWQLLDDMYGVCGLSDLTLDITKATVGCVCPAEIRPYGPRYRCVLADDVPDGHGPSHRKRKRDHPQPGASAQYGFARILTRPFTALVGTLRGDVES